MKKQNRTSREALEVRRAERERERVQGTCPFAWADLLPRQLVGFAAWARLDADPSPAVRLAASGEARGGLAPSGGFGGDWGMAAFYLEPRRKTRELLPEAPN